MTTTQQSPETSLATVRRVPRYGVFMVLGAVVAVIATLVLVTIGAGGFDAVLRGDVTRTPFGVEYSFGQVFGFTVLFLVPIGIALGALTAMLLERLSSRKDRVVRVQHETIATVDEHPDS